MLTATLKDKVALVTGASRGIGQSIALSLGSAGAFVYGTATTESGAESITASFADSGIRGKGLVLDVSSSESIDALQANMKAQEGLPHILVNNAGITRDNLLLRISEDDWEAILNTNLTSIYRLCKANLRHMMKARWGRIINISSVVAATGNPGQCNYSAAKAGVEAFSRSLAQEVGSRDITVNAIAPGFIQTDMTDKLTEEQKTGLVTNMAIKRLGTPDDIANAALFLASESSGYITGQCLHVNGGLYMN